MPALRSLIFNIAFYGWTTIACFGLLWMLLLPRRHMIAVVRWYLDTVGWLERTILGLDYEVRGRENLPAGACIVAAKHQSAWETMKLHALFGDPAIVLKRELTWIPIWGWYARKARMIAVDRGARGKALSSMIENSRPVAAEGRPIVIFPQGTRTAPGAYRGYTTPELDAMLEKTRVLTDEGARRAAVQDVMKHLLENAVHVPLYTPGWEWVFAVRPEVAGFKVAPFVYPVFNDVKL